MTNSMPDSRFFMWRALFAIAHADNIVTVEERTMMNKVLAEQPFSEAQKEILTADMAEKKDIKSLFMNISDQQDRSDFFKFARSLVWIDGDFGADEQKVMTDLGQMHMKMMDFDTFGGSQDMQFEDEPIPAAAQSPVVEPRKEGAFTRLLKALTGN